MFIGDSVGVQWYSLFNEAFAQKGCKLVILTKSSCPIVDEPYFYARIKRRFRVCEQWREKAIEYIKRSEPSRVIVGSSNGYPFNPNHWTGRN